MRCAVVRQGRPVEDTVLIGSRPRIEVRSRRTRHHDVAVAVHDIRRRNRRRGDRRACHVLNHVSPQRVRRPQLEHVTTGIQQVDFGLVLRGLRHLDGVTNPVNRNSAVVVAELLFLAVENARTTHTGRGEFRHQRHVDGLAVFRRKFVLDHDDGRRLAAHVGQEAGLADIFRKVVARPLLLFQSGRKKCLCHGRCSL